MTTRNPELTRRQYLAAASASVLAAGLGPLQAQALPTIRQGYQTNMWGMPTYYMLKSGALEKRGLKFEEFAVPSGNQTMQQMVAKQVDLGTYAGPSLILGHARGGMVAVAMIEHVGKSLRVMARKELNITKLEQLKGKKIANQVGASSANIFNDHIAPTGGLNKGDFQEVRMNVNDMVAAMVAKTVDAMVCVEPYNAIAEDDGIATTVVDFFDFDKLPVFMAATPDFAEKHPELVVTYLKAWLEVARDFKDNPNKVTEVIHAFYTSKGYTMSPATLKKAMSTVEVNPGFPADLEPYMQKHAEVLLKENKISALPDWKKVLRTDFMEKARATG